MVVLHAVGAPQAQAVHAGGQVVAGERLLRRFLQPVGQRAGADTFRARSKSISRVKRARASSRVGAAQASRSPVTTSVRSASVLTCESAFLT